MTYWCRLAALQSGLSIDKKSKEALALLLPLMDWLEKEKKVLKDQEGISRLGQLLKISYLSILLLCDPFEMILPDDETLDLPYLKKITKSRLYQSHSDRLFSFSYSSVPSNFVTS